MKQYEEDLTDPRMETSKCPYVIEFEYDVDETIKFMIKLLWMFLG